MITMLHPTSKLMHNNGLMILFILSAFSAVSQAPSDMQFIVNPGEDTVYTALPDTCHPRFPGGDEANRSLIFQNIRYPADARERGVDGTVVVSMIIEKDGRRGEPMVETKVYPSLDAESLRVARLIPDGWIPATHLGRPVRFKYLFPVSYKLQGRNPPPPVKRNRN